MKTTTLLLAAALAVSIHSAQAANGNWTGSTSGNWNVISNWTGLTFPTTGETATFNAAVVNSTISMNNTAIAVGTISFTGSNTGSYAFNAGGVGGSLAGAITMASDVMNMQTFNLPVQFGHNSSYTNNSTNADLNLAGGIDANQARASTTVTFTGSGNTSINGVTQTGGGTVIFIKDGTGKVTLSSSPFTGQVDVRGGILLINSANALDSNLTILRGGILGLGAGDLNKIIGTGTGNFRFISTATQPFVGFAAYGADRIVNLGTSMPWGGGISSTLGAGQNLAFGSADSTHKINFQTNIGISSDLSGIRTIVVNDGVNSNNVDGEISGVISGSGASVIKTGAGTLLLSGTNTYTGLTTVSVGTLLVGNSSGVGSLAGGATVASGAVLGGSGSIAGVTTIQSGARLAPGNSPGLLTVNNDVTIEDGGIFTVEVNGTTAGTGYDRLAMTGGGSDFSLTGSNDLEMSLGFTPAANALFFLVDNAGGSAISGIFESLNGVVTDLSQGALFSVGGQDFNISYTGDLVGNAFTGGDDLVIQAVPEPTTWVMLALGGLFLLGFRRRAHC